MLLRLKLSAVYQTRESLDIHIKHKLTFAPDAMATVANSSIPNARKSGYSHKTELAGSFILVSKTLKEKKNESFSLLNVSSQRNNHIKLTNYEETKKLD